MIVDNLIFSVPGVSCEHCRAAITKEVTRSRASSPSTSTSTQKLVSVRGHDVDDAEVRAAIDEAGYDVADA